MADNSFRRTPLESFAHETNKPKANTDPKLEMERIAINTGVPVNFLLAFSEKSQNQDPTHLRQGASRAADMIAERMKDGTAPDAAIRSIIGNDQESEKFLTRARQIADEFYPLSETESNVGTGGVLTTGGDTAKQLGGGVVKGAGMSVSGAGRLRGAAGDAIGDHINEQGTKVYDTIASLPGVEKGSLGRNILDANKTIAKKGSELVSTANSAVDSAIRFIGDQIQGGGEAIQDSVSEGGKEEIAASAPSGDLFKPSTWSFGSKPSAEGVLLMTADVVGTLVPVVAAGIATGGAGAVAVGGSQGAEGGGQTAEQIIDEAFQAGTLSEDSSYFKRLTESGVSEAEALDRTKQAASKLAALFAAPIAAFGGKLTSNLATQGLRGVAGRGVATRVGAGAAVGAVEEGTQEALEGIAARTGVNAGAEAEFSTTNETFGDFVMGALAGGPIGGAGGIQKQDQDSGDGVVAAPPLPDAPLDNPSNGIPSDARADIPLGGALDGEEAAGIIPPGADIPVVSSQEPEPKPKGPLENALSAAPAPMLDHLQPNSPITIAGDGFADIEGEYAGETPEGVKFIDEDGVENVIPRSEIESGEVRVGPRTQPDQGSIADQAMATEPMAEPEDTGPKTFEEAMEYVRFIEEQAKTNGWNANLKRRYDLANIAAEQLAEEPDVSLIDLPESAYPDQEDLAAELRAESKAVEPALDAELDAQSKESRVEVEADKADAQDAIDPAEPNVWDELSEAERSDLLVRAKFTKKDGSLNAQGQRLSKKPFSELKTGAQERIITSYEAMQMKAESPAPAAKPMKAAAKRTQPDMLGGPEVSENDLAAADTSRTTLGRVAGMVSSDRHTDISETMNGFDLKGMTVNGKPIIRVSKDGNNVAEVPVDQAIGFIVGQMKKATDTRSVAAKTDVIAEKKAPRDEVPKSVSRTSSEVKDSPKKSTKSIESEVNSRAEIAAAAKEADPNPTDAQKEAENYKKGHILWNGFDISIENAKGSTRSGTGARGKKWSVKMPAHYGYIKGTKGADGDHLDVYMGERPESDYVVVVDQKDIQTGRFDEHKIILGTSTKDEALKLYADGFSDGLGADRVKGFREFNDLDTFKQWVEQGDTTKQVVLSDIGAEALLNKTPQKEAEQPTAGLSTLSDEENAELAKLEAEFLDLSKNLRSGLDPQMVAVGFKIGTLYVKAGKRKFAQIIETMVDRLGMSYEDVQPYARNAYNQIRDDMELRGEDVTDMDDASAVVSQVRETLQDLKKSPERAKNDQSNETKEDTDAARSDERDDRPKPEEGSEAPTGGSRSVSEPRVKRDEAGDGNSDSTGNGPERTSKPDRGSTAKRDRGINRELNAPQNHIIKEGELEGTGGDKTRARRSVSAIRTLRTLEDEGRFASPDERMSLAAYGGAGTLAQALPNSDGITKFEDIAEELNELLSEEEMQTLSRTSQYAFYTAEPALRSMWALAQKLGFQGGRVYEPGMGVGGFAGTVPEAIIGQTQYQGIELDHVTAGIAKSLYPKSSIKQGDFIKEKLPQNFYDIVVGNPPFSSTKIQADPDYPQRFLIHDYFFAKSLDAVRPGGILMFITSAGTMNKQDSSARDYMADQADLLGAMRLPNTAFKENGTRVTTDIIVLRKRLEGETEADPAWRKSEKQTMPDADGGTGEAFVNDYFTKNPDMILGEQGLFDTLVQGKRVGVRPNPGKTLQEELVKAISKFPSEVMSKATNAQKLNAIDADTKETKAGSYYEADGKLMQFDGRVGVEVTTRSKENSKGVPKTQAAIIRDLIPIKMALRSVLSADADEVDATGARAELNTAYEKFVKKHGPINKAVESYRKPSRVEMEGIRQKAIEDARNAGEMFDIGSFDAATELSETATLSEVAKARAEAVEQSGYSDGDFNPEDVPAKVLVKRPNIDPFSDDQESYRLRSIEKYNSVTGEAEKGLVFTQSVISKADNPKINSPEDALLFVLGDEGAINIPRIAELSNSSPDQVIEELSGKIFRNPETKRWETKSRYLSGNVRKKLDAAEKAAIADPSLNANVEELQRVLPDPIPSTEISTPIGSSWFAESLYSDFAKTLGLSLEASFKPALGLWVVSGSKTGNAATSDYGTQDKPFSTLMDAILNGRAIKITRTVKNGDGTTSTFTDETATQEASDKAKELQDRFKDWIWSDEKRSGQLEDRYNEVFNSDVAPQYDGDYLTTPGVNSSWNWRPHQRSVIARILQSGNTYMAHTVGAGKTSAMIGAAMEAKRLGLKKKPMFVVPNHMLAQFATEFYEQYPLANIAIADEKRFHTSRRKEFVADITLNSYDAVIITHSAFKMIPPSEKAKMRAVKAFLDDVREIIEGGGLEGADRGDEMATQRAILGSLKSIGSSLGIKEDKTKGASTRKKIEAIMEAAEQRFSRLTSTERTDDVFEFDDIGVDQLFVDEAHEFRKLSFATTAGTIKGIDPTGSAGALDLFIKTQVINNKTPGEGVIFASGTPVTNTMAELYSISRFLQPEELKARGVSAFDAWKQTFGTTSSDLEQTPDGGYKQVSRFAKFVNAPELSLMVRQVMDVVSGPDLEQYVTRPKLKNGQRTLVVAEPSEELVSFQEGLGVRMKAIQQRKGPAAKGDDIMLSVINDGRLAAIDMRLVDPSATGANSKLERLINNVHKRYTEGAETPLHGVKSEGGYTDDPVMTGPSTQIVFSTLGVNPSKHNSGFSVHSYIKAELVRRGVPAEEIIMTEDLKTHAQKARAFNDMNEGKKRIMIGSKKIFTGVNAQKRISALHNLDPLWFPADDEQRNGRGLRQGNMNPEIEILDYSTKATYDATMWQMMGRKAAFIESFFRGDPTVREIEDVGQASVYDQAKAMSTANPRVLEMTELQGEADKLKRRRDALDRKKSRFASERRSGQSMRSRYSESLPRWEALSARVENTQGDAFKVKVGKAEIDSRKTAGMELIDVAEEYLAKSERVDEVKVGEISGFDILMDTSLAAQEATIYVKADEDAILDIGWSTDPVGLVRKIETTLSHIKMRPTEIKSRISEAVAKIKSAEDGLANVGRFSEQEQLDAIIEKISEIEAELIAETAETENDDDKARESRFDSEPTKVSRAAGADIANEMNQELDRIGISTRVKARFADGMNKAAGIYNKGDIQADSMDTLNHEVIHALRDSALWSSDFGLFTPAEWKSLVRNARSDKALMQRVATRYPDFSPSERVEEVIAEQYRAYRKNGKSKKSLFDKIGEVFSIMADVLMGHGFTRASEVFDNIASSGFATRAASAAPAQENLSEGEQRYLREISATPIRNNKRSLDKKDRGLISRALTDAMGGKFNLLALVPGRALFAELGRTIGSAQRYLTLKEEMDAMRQEWHERTNNTAQDWRKLISDDSEANADMMDLMHESTKAGVDPSQPFLDIDGINARQKSAKTQKRKAAHTELSRRFRKLPSKFQKMFNTVRDSHSAMSEAFEKAIIDNVEKSLDISVERAIRRYEDEMQRIKDDGLKGDERIEAEAEALRIKTSATKRGGWQKGSRLARLRQEFETNKITAPYFPLMRFGQYFVTVRDRVTSEVLSFSKFETEKQQIDFINSLEEDADTEVQSGRMDPEGGHKDQVDPSFVADIEGMVGDAVGDPAVMDLIWQRWLETLPDYSIRKSRIHRKGTSGYSEDAFRAFGRQMFHGSHQLARLNYGLDMQKALEDADREAAVSDDPNRMSAIVQEMSRRHEFVMNPTGSAAAQTMTTAAFVYYLGVSPSSAAVNLSQTTVVGIPVLAGGFSDGTISKAAKQLSRALGDFTRGKGNAADSGRVTEDEKAAMAEAYRRGIVDRSMSHDLAGISDTGVQSIEDQSTIVGKVRGKAKQLKVMEKVSFLFHNAERLNREVTFLAAYRMALDSGLSGNEAIAKAGDLTWKTHFDYQNTSRPRLLQNDVSRVLLVFRNFQINMLWRLFRDAHQAFKGKDPELRREARFHLVGMTGMMMLHAGITGTWGYALLTMLLGIFADDGSDDIEEELQSALVNALGTDLAGMLLKGVPGHLTGMNLTNRMGMPELWFRSSDRTLEGADEYNYWVTEMIGAVPGIGENIHRGTSRIIDGDVLRGLETMAPKFIRDLMKAQRYWQDGVTTYKGDPIVDQVSIYQALVQAIGFTPAEVAEQYQTNTRMKNKEKRITGERKKILSEARKDIKARKPIRQSVWDDVSEFNDENREYRITPKTINKSYRSSLAASLRNEGGVQLNSKLNRRIRDEAAPLIYN